jgi:chemotaxis protein methyltransferase CheR
LMRPPLTDDEYRLFSEWLASEYGLRFGPEKREILRARLEPSRVELDLPTFERLLFHIRYHPAGAGDRLRVLSSVTNNESYFFREGRQLDVLRDEILPQLADAARRAGRSEVRALSAGSASGEEAYTLAIIGREVLPGSAVRLDVTGLDLDSDAVDRARQARYRDHAFRGVDPRVRDRYFRPEERGWRLVPEIRAAARFEQGNLMDPAWTGRLPPQDVVFCRNVLIYFDEAGLRTAVENLYQTLRPGGYLFLGHAETLSRTPTRFVPERRPGSVFYRRPEE